MGQGWNELLITPLPRVSVNKSFAYVPTHLPPASTPASPSLSPCRLHLPADHPPHQRLGEPEEATHFRLERLCEAGATAVDVLEEIATLARNGSRGDSHALPARGLVLCHLVGRFDPPTQELGGVAERAAHVHRSLRG